MSKKSGGGRRPKFQTSRTQSLEDASKGGKQTLWAFVNFYLETVLNPFGDSTLRIMTGFFEVSQLGLATPQMASYWGAVHKAPWRGALASGQLLVNESG